jgi:hypothetical protein
MSASAGWPNWFHQRVERCLAGICRAHRRWWIAQAGAARQLPEAGGKLSDEADQSDGANQPDSSGSSDEVPLE